MQSAYTSGYKPGKYKKLFKNILLISYFYACKNANYMEQEESRTTQLETAPIGKLLWQYALPAIISMSVGALYNIIDRIFIGQALNPMAISGMTLTLPIHMIIVAIGTLVGVGASTRISIVLGMKNPEWAKHILGNAVFLTFILSVILTIASLIYLDEILVLFGGSEKTIPYARDFLNIVIPGSIFSNLTYNFTSIMRATGYPLKSMRILVSGVIINTILAPIFIFWLDMGVQGGAIATVISMFVGFILVSIHFLSPKTEIRLSFPYLVPAWKIIMNIVSIGLSPFLMHLATSLVILVFNHNLKKHGGDLAIGAYGIVNSYATFIVMCVMGFTQGMQPIVGYNFGAGKIKRIKDTLIKTIRLTVIVTTIGFIGAELFPRQIAFAFTKNPEFADIIAKGLKINLCTFFIVGYQIAISSFFLSIGKTGVSIFMSLSRQLIFLLPLLYLLSSIWGLDGIWMAGAVSDILAALVATLFLIRQRNIFYKR